MVRVVSCHHFVSQDVFLSEGEPIAFCGAQDKLLLSTTQHVVNVHDLNTRGNVLHSFPSIDVIKQIQYCELGNYVVTLESNPTRQQKLLSCVRVYFKWWIDVSNQPLKVRIAGSAPTYSNSLSWSKSLEIVELPIEKSALFVAYCKKTSALAVSTGHTISVFCYSTKIHNASKQLFHDFDHFTDITIPIFAKELDFFANHFICRSERAVHVFKICTDSGNPNSGADIEIDSENCSEDFIEWRFESCTYEGDPDKKWEAHIQSKLDISSFPIEIHLPMIDKANETFKGTDECEYHGPMLKVRGCPVDVALDPKAYEMFPTIPSDVYAVTLLFRQFKLTDKNIQLKTIKLLPLYQLETMCQFEDPLKAAAEELTKEKSHIPFPNLISQEKFLKGIGCFFTLPSEGYVYDITFSTKLINSYPYTSPLKGVAIDLCFLYALTETGLETYTVHLPLSVLEEVERPDKVRNIVPSCDESVCLLGLRPFLGVDNLVASDNHLVLVSSIEDSVVIAETEGQNRSTLYALKIPSVIQVHSDLLEAAELQRAQNPDTYFLLLIEAHMVLRTQLFLKKQFDKEMDSLFKKSSLLIANYLVCGESDQKVNAVPYYHLSSLSAENVVKKLLEYRQHSMHGNVLKSLIPYLNSILFESEPVQFSPSSTVADAILTAYFEESPEILWKIILCSKLIDFVKIDKAIHVLKKRLTAKKQQNSSSSAADNAALVYLLLQKDNTEAAQAILMSILSKDLVSVLKEVYPKIWDGKKLTGFGYFVKQVRPNVFVELLGHYIDAKSHSFSDIVQFLQSESPNLDVHQVPLLKEFLETSLCAKIEYTNENKTLIMLLIKIYLKHLLQPNDSRTKKIGVCTSSFAAYIYSRPDWLNEMPPFDGKSISATCSFSASQTDDADKEIELCRCWNCNENLLKLQSLLTYLGPPDEIRETVLEFLFSSGRGTEHFVSLEIICLPETPAIKKLINATPRAILPYAKEVFKQDIQKWALLFSQLSDFLPNLSENDEHYEIYATSFEAILSQLAENTHPVELLAIFPKNDEDKKFLPHMKRCVEKHQADLLRQKIMSLGQEIKSMMLT